MAGKTNHHLPIKLRFVIFGYFHDIEYSSLEKKRLLLATVYFHS